MPCAQTVFVCTRLFGPLFTGSCHEAKRYNRLPHTQRDTGRLIRRSLTAHNTDSCYENRHSTRGQYFPFLFHLHDGTSMTSILTQSLSLSLYLPLHPFPVQSVRFVGTRRDFGFSFPFFPSPLSSQHFSHQKLRGGTFEEIRCLSAGMHLIAKEGG